MKPARGRRRAAPAPTPPPVLRLSPPVLHFMKGWQEQQSAPIQRGQPLRIVFDAERLSQCRMTMRGAEFWDIVGHVVCHPAGQRYEQSMLEAIRSTPNGPIVTMRSAPFDFVVPIDATRLELWFDNMDTYYRTCRVWDSDFGRNYWFGVEGPEPQPRDNVAYRRGAIPDLSIVNVAGQRVRKENVSPAPPRGSRVRRDLQTKLGVWAWVRNLAYEKHVWVDLHVFDADDVVIARQTLPLQWQTPGSGGGDSFVLDATAYCGSTATPGSTSQRSDARKLQYRMYYEASGRVYTDGIAHEQQLPEDAVVW